MIADGRSRCMDSTRPYGTVVRPVGENRLTISLLLVWTFSVSLVLANQLTWVALPQMRWLSIGLLHEVALRTLVAVSVGCGVGSVLYWLVPGLRRHSFPCQPGHWLLLAFGAFWIAGVCLPPAWNANQSATLAGLLATSAVLAIG